MANSRTKKSRLEAQYWGFFFSTTSRKYKNNNNNNNKDYTTSGSGAKCWHKLLLLLLLCITYALQEYQDLQHKQHSIYRHRQTDKPTHRDTGGLLNYKGAQINRKESSNKTNSLTFSIFSFYLYTLLSITSMKQRLK